MNTNIKVVMCGDISVGKTSIMSRFFKKKFDYEEQSTIGASFYTKKHNYNGVNLNLQFWDTAGQERYAPLLPLYYRSAGGIIIVYDVTDRDSYENIKKRWLNEIRHSSDIPFIGMIGNKIDLKQNRKVTIREAFEFAKENKLLFEEVSALDNKNVEIFLNRFVENMYDNEYIAQRTNKLEIENLVNNRNTWCCF